MKQIFIFLLSLVFSFSNAQIVSINPTNANVDTDSNPILTFDASEGNAGLKDYTGDVYAHIGVTVNGKDWQQAPNWGDNATKYKLTRSASNKNIYTLTLSPNIRQYFGVKAEDLLTKLCMVFRSGDKSKEGKGDGNSDIFLDVNPNQLTLAFRSPKANSGFFDVSDVVNIDVLGQNATEVSLFIDGTEVKKVNSTSLTHSYTITEGSHQIKVSATNGAKTIVDSLTVQTAPNVVTEELPDGVKLGINPTSDNSVILALKAPKKQAVHVVGDFNNWKLDNNYLMKRASDNETYWIEIKSLDPNTEYAYQYLVDGHLSIADPYSEKILDSYNDQYISNETYPNLKAYPKTGNVYQTTVFKINDEQYKWDVLDFKPVEKNKLLIYELLVRDFTQGPEGKEGNFNGVKSKLDYIQNLGVNAVEFLPINEFDGNDSWGYNPSFHMALDKVYGTKNQFKSLVDSLHARGIAVIVDVVLNHAFGPNSYARLYNEDGAWGNPTSDNPFFNVSPTHPFNVGYDMNHESKYTQEYVKRILQYWITEYKIDGYRFDLSKGFTQTNYGDNVGAWSGYDAGRIAILKKYNSYIKEVKPGALVILEHLGGDQEERELAADGMMLWGNMNHQASSAIKGDNGSDLSRVKASNRGMQDSSLIGYYESHDEERLTYSLKSKSSSDGYQFSSLSNVADRMGAMHALLVGLPGPKMMWQFGEVAYDISINQNGRTGRKPIKWSYFDDTNRKRLYNTISRLANMRNNNSVFQTSDWSISSNQSDDIHITNLNDRNSDTYVVTAANFGTSNKRKEIVFPKTGVYFYNTFTGDSINVNSKSQYLEILAGNFIMYSNKKLNGAVIKKYVDPATPIKSVDIEKSEPVFKMRGRNTVAIDVMAKTTKKIIVDVYDFRGNRVKAINTIPNIGLNNIFIDFTTMANYIFVVKVDGKTYSKKLFIPTK